MKPSTYYLRSFGCQMNEHDAERIRAAVEGLGLRSVTEPLDADVLIYNTCTVRRSADERLAGHLSLAGRLKLDDPRRVVVVTGCLPQAEKSRLFAQFPYVDLALGPQALPRLPNELQEVLEERGAASGLSRPAAPRGCFLDAGTLSADLPAVRSRPHHAWVQIVAGCTNLCSYCIVPYVRGPERSRHPDAVEDEVRALVADGVLEVTLLGQNVNAYGGDLPSDQRERQERRSSFAGLLRRLDAIHGLRRIRFMTSHPKDLSDDLIAAIAALPTVCEHVHLPAQSGSNEVLRSMSRGYTTDWYLERVAALRAAMPDVALTSDLMVGFPGEDEDDFQATLNLVRAAGFDAAFTFVYSPRRGTAAADMPRQVPDEIKKRRVRELIALTQRQSLERRSRLVGKTAEVLVEGASRHGHLWRGRTRQNITVNFSGPAKPGDLIDVRITDATSTTLKGTI
jgi:tRNA-2-methylthio-N6-dimethylallyladenosine synthase